MQSFFAFSLSEVLLSTGDLSFRQTSPTMCVIRTIYAQWIDCSYSDSETTTLFQTVSSHTMLSGGCHAGEGAQVLSTPRNVLEDTVLHLNFLNLCPTLHWQVRQGTEGNWKQLANIQLTYI